MFRASNALNMQGPLIINKLKKMYHVGFTILIVHQTEGYLRNWLLQNTWKRGEKEITDRRDLELHKVPEIKGVRAHC
jgi:hypothetical protein